MWALLFARNNRDFDVLEAAGFQKLVELHFTKPEPMIGIKLASALEPVAEQVQDHDPSALSQDAMSARDRALGMNGVMQRLTQNREVDRPFADRRIFDIAEPILEIREAVLLCQFSAKLDHLRRIIDRDHLARGFGEELREGSFYG